MYKYRSCIYISPQYSENSNVNKFADITDDVSYIIFQHSTGDGTILIGDFNAHTRHYMRDI